MRIIVGLFLLLIGCSVFAGPGDREQTISICEGPQADNPCQKAGLQNHQWPYTATSKTVEYCMSLANVKAGNSSILSEAKAFCSIDDHSDYASCGCVFKW